MKIFSKISPNRWFSRIGTKIAMVVSLLIGLISVFIFMFFPARLEDQAIGAISDKAKRIAEMTAFSVSPALFFEDMENIELVLRSARQNKDLTYIVVVNESGDKIAEFNKDGTDLALTHKQKLNYVDKAGAVYRATTPILLNDREIGQLYLGISLKELKVEVARSRIVIASISLLIFIIGIIGAFVISMVITGPLSRMVGTVERISQGDLKQRAEISSKDELGNLARSFNLMVDSLESAYNELESINSELEGRVEDRTKELKKEVNERRLAEEALAAEKEQLSVTLRSIGDGVITTDVEGKVVLVNSAAETLTGCTQAEAFGKPLSQVFHIISEKTRERCDNPVRKVLQSGRTVSSADHTILVSRHGTERVIADSGAPIRDMDGNLIGVVLVFHDITERRKMEEELLKTQKLESIGILAGGIAHDFNNILTAILGSISLARMYADPKSKVFDRLEDAERSSLRAQDLTQQLLTFSRGGMPIKKTATIAELLRHSVNFVLSGSNVRCEFFISDDLWPVEVDEGQISQVINNIVINARQAMPRGGVIRVRAENTSMEAGHGLPTPPGEYVGIAIEDQGVGIPEDHLQRIFDPYFSTKQEGSGLGLATCYSIIKNHDGYINVESQIGVSTTFRIYLPAHPEETPANTMQEEERLDTGNGRILLMDDEEEIRNLANEMLTNIGYEVVVTKDGAETIEIYKEAKESGDTFDAVIMDLTIPGGIGGKETIQVLMEIDPEVRAIVSSGYSKDPVMSNFTEYGFKEIMPKPYGMKQLSETLYKVLSA